VTRATKPVLTLWQGEQGRQRFRSASGGDPMTAQPFIVVVEIGEAIG
jgi:hypothetical protein